MVATNKPLPWIYVAFIHLLQTIVCQTTGKALSRLVRLMTTVDLSGQFASEKCHLEGSALFTRRPFTQAPRQVASCDALGPEGKVKIA